MTGEMSKADVTREAYPVQFAIADAMGATVHPFDQYQGPYLRFEGRRYWLLTDDETCAPWEGRIYAETADELSEPFNLDNLDAATTAMRDLVTHGGEAVEHARAVAQTERRQAKALHDAAPELLAALKTVFDNWQRGVPMNHLTPTGNAVAEAIAKAEGC